MLTVLNKRIASWRKLAAERRKVAQKPSRPALQVEVLEGRIVPSAPVNLPVPLANAQSLQIVPSYEIPTTQNGPATFIANEQFLRQPNAILNAAAGGWENALNNQPSLKQVAGQLIAQTTGPIDNASLFGVNLGFNISTNNLSFNITNTESDINSSGLNYRFDTSGQNADFYDGLDQANRTLWLEYVVHNNSATVHIDVGAGWSGVVAGLAGAAIPYIGPFGAAALAGGIGWIPATGIDLGLTFDSVVVVGIQFPGQPTPGQNANYVKLNKTDYSDVFQALQGL
ncbi:MAG TPA: hypothetical protein VKS79_23430, partial [Gemmataceae bacterium]|nr:hypothetical protein [Gemmataceae bacterium]